MKYIKCPRCGINYILPYQQHCSVCKDELEGRKSIFDTEDYDNLICPYCEKNTMDIDEVMCKQCAKRRSKKQTDD